MKLSSLIGHCAEALEAIFANPLPADIVLNGFFRARKYLGSKDRAYIAESVYHVLRHRRRLEWMNECFFGPPGGATPEDASSGSIPASAFSHPPISRPALSVFVLSLLENATGDEAVSVATALAEREELAIDAKRFVGIARDLLSKPHDLPWPEAPVARMALECSLPDWLVERNVEMLGEEEARQLGEACNQAAPVILRVNTMKAPREAVQAALEAEGYPCDPTRLSPFGLTLRERANVFTTETFKRGWFEIQDEASQMVSLCVDPKPGARVLDACAGGGGKTLHLSALMGGRGAVFALDVSKRRLDSLRDRARRDDCQNVRVTRVSPDAPPPAELIGKMQYLLIDAPCTGMGVLRRNPDARWKVTPEVVRELAAKQRAILEHYLPCLAPAGRLVYATCSTLHEEDEAVVDDFIAAHNDFKPANLAAILSRHGLERLVAPASHCLRLWPHRHGTDGFFVAVLERAAHGDSAPARH
jgi:16S rRNA (cytosine967-C5)-methyltransferase